jgi:nucleoside-diphosphate-sugar epimerase
MGATVSGFATRAESLREIAAAGVVAIPLDLDAGVPAPLPLAGQLVYYSVPPSPQRDEDARLERFLRQIQGIPARLIYLSTTGVYGDHAGAYVDEETPATPLSARARRRVAAETGLRRWAEAMRVSWCILRVAGIYGPGRLPLERLRDREPAIAPAEALPTNRIQVDDLVSACVAGALSPAADRRVVNVTDGSDDSSTAFLQRVARITGLPPPPLVSRTEARTTFSASSWSFLGESRRVSNRRLREELGVRLAYEDLDAGIRASLAEDAR